MKTEKVFTLGVIRKLEQQITKGEISTSRYIEILNEMANQKCQEQNWISMEDIILLRKYFSDGGYSFDDKLSFKKRMYEIFENIDLPTPPTV